MSPLVFVLLFFTVTGKLKHIFFLFVELFVASGQEIFSFYPVLIIGHGRQKVVAGLDEIFNPLVPPGRDAVVVLVYKGTRYFGAPVVSDWVKSFVTRSQKRYSF
jgi:hypothetical protein